MGVCYRGVTGMIQKCYRGVTEVLQRCHRSDTGMLQRCSKDLVCGEVRCSSRGAQDACRESWVACENESQRRRVFIRTHVEHPGEDGRVKIRDGE
jgi:hypothetical protein